MDLDSNPSDEELIQIEERAKQREIALRKKEQQRKKEQEAENERKELEADDLLHKVYITARGGDFDNARDLIQTLAVDYPGTKAAKQLPEVEKQLLRLTESIAAREAEAAKRLATGKKAFDAGKWAESRRHFVAVIKQFHGTKAAREARVLEMQAADKEAGEMLPKVRALAKSGKLNDLMTAKRIAVRIQRISPNSDAAKEVPELTKQIDVRILSAREEEARRELAKGKNALDEGEAKTALWHFDNLVRKYDGAEAAEDAKKLKQVVETKLAESEFKRAKTAYEAGKLELAKQLFLEVARRFPYIEAGKTVKQLAAKIDGEIAASVEQLARRHLNNARRHLEDGDWTEARKELDRLFDEYPATSTAEEGKEVEKLLVVEEAAFQAEQKQKEQEEVNRLNAANNRRLLEIWERKAAPKLRNAKVDIENGNVEMARRHLIYIVDKYPGTDAAKEAARLEAKYKDSDREKQIAEAAAQQAAKKTDVENRLLLAQNCYRRGDLEGARKYLGKLGREVREYPELQQQAVELWQKVNADLQQIDTERRQNEDRKRNEEAAEALKQVQKTFEAGNQESGYEELRTLVNEYSGTDAAHEARKILKEQEKREAAIEAGRRDRAAERDAEKQLESAVESAKAKKWDDARREIDNIITSRSGGKARKNALILLAKINEIDSSERLREAEKATKAGNLPEAIALLNQVINEFPGTEAAKKSGLLKEQAKKMFAAELCEQGKVLLLSDVGEAKKLLQRVITEFPTTPAADEARSILKK